MTTMRQRLGIVRGSVASNRFFLALRSIWSPAKGQPADRDCQSAVHARVVEIRLGWPSEFKSTLLRNFRNTLNNQDLSR